MAHSKIEDLYYRFINGFVEDLKSDEFYEYFTNMVKSGNSNIMLNEKYVERNIDIRWVEAIEDTIIPLDNIIRTPNRFIKNIEEVVNIEMARTISTESVRHLATHTNYIAQVKGDEVIPQKILNVIKEESFETYENRFIFTLLFKLEYFLDKRMQVLMTNNKVADKYEMKFDGSCTAGHDEISYDISMNYVTPHIELTNDDLQVSADVTKLTSMQRIERLRKILYSFKNSALIKSLANCAMVRPPLTMTNVLTKNPNFKKCVDLWRFIERYEDIGFSVNVVERLTTPSQQHVNDMFSLLTLQYVVMKKNTQHTDEIGDYSERRKGMEPNIVKKSIEELIENYDLDINEIRRIFTDQLEKKRKKIKAEFTKINDIIKRAIAADKQYLANYNELRKKRESKAELRKKAELAALLQEELAKKELVEKEHLEEEGKKNDIVGQLSEMFDATIEDVHVHVEKEESDSVAPIADEEQAEERFDENVEQTGESTETVGDASVEANSTETEEQPIEEIVEETTLEEQLTEEIDEQITEEEQPTEEAVEESTVKEVPTEEIIEEVAVEEHVAEEANEPTDATDEPTNKPEQEEKENKFLGAVKEVMSKTKDRFATVAGAISGLFKKKNAEEVAEEPAEKKQPTEETNESTDGQTNKPEQEEKDNKFLGAVKEVMSKTKDTFATVAGAISGLFKKKNAEEVVEETTVEEQPAEEVVEEATVEEQPAEEVVEETTVEEQPAEEVVEEATVEEQPAEEVVEETTVEEQPAEEVVEEQPTEETVEETLKNKKLSHKDRRRERRRNRYKQ